LSGSVGYRVNGSDWKRRIRPNPFHPPDPFPGSCGFQNHNCGNVCAALRAKITGGLMATGNPARSRLRPGRNRTPPFPKVPEDPTKKKEKGRDFVGD